MRATRIVVLFTLIACATNVFASVSSAANQRRATELSQANGTLYRLLGSCMAGEQTCARNERTIEQSLSRLESNSLSAGSAGKYRQARIKIDEGYRYYGEAKSAAGRERSRLVELGNAAMEIAKNLILAAYRFFESVLPRILSGEGWGGSGSGDDDDRDVKCKKKRDQRLADCEEEYQEELREIQRLWEERHRDCMKMYRRNKAEGMSEADAQRELARCRDDANNEKRRKEQAAARRKQLCEQEAEEKYRRCLNGEDD